MVGRKEGRAGKGVVVIPYMASQDPGISSYRSDPKSWILGQIRRMKFGLIRQHFVSDIPFYTGSVRIWDWT